MSCQLPKEEKRCFNSQCFLKRKENLLPRSYARSYNSLSPVLYNLKFLFDGSSPRTSVTAGSSTRGLALAAAEAVGISKLNGPASDERRGQLAGLDLFFSKVPLKARNPPASLGAGGASTLIVPPG